MAKLNFRDIISTDTNDNQFINNHDANYDYMKVGNKYYAKRKNAGNDEWFDISGNMEATNKLDQYLSNGGDDNHSLPVKKNTVKPKTVVTNNTNNKKVNNTVNNTSNSKISVTPKTDTTKKNKETSKTNNNNKSKASSPVSVVARKNNTETKNTSNTKANTVTQTRRNLSNTNPRRDTNDNLIKYAPSTRRVEEYTQFLAGLTNRTPINTNNEQPKKNNSAKIAAARESYNQSAQAELNKRYYKK